MVKKKLQAYSFAESLEMLNRLQQMAVDEGNINLALKAEELKCKIAAMQTDKESSQSAENLTKILVDFINDKQNDSKNTENICSADET
nr:MAG TPA: hypothetical protein [Bacteriophage sp.]